MTQFKKIALGGTFDHFHYGHLVFLGSAFLNAEKVVIGLTTDNLIKNKPYSWAIQTFKERKKNLLNYLSQRDRLKKAEIVPLEDSFGPSISQKDIEALVVTSRTKKTALMINRIRKRRNLPPLTILEVPLLRGMDKRIISSDRIRRGEINQLGENYWEKTLELFKNRETIYLPEKLKERLRKPLGKVFAGSESQIIKTGESLANYIKKYQPKILISVGDIVSFSLIKNNLVPSITVVDFYSKKKAIGSEIKRLINYDFHFKTSNKPSTLNKKAVVSIQRAVKEFLTKKRLQKIFVEGEEDLLVLPAIIFSPLKCLIVYGHWQYGAIVIEVSETIKEKVVKLLKRFKKDKIMVNT